MIGRSWPFHVAKISAGTGRVRVFLITSPGMRGNDSVAFNIQALPASTRLFAVAKSIAEAAMTTLMRISPRYCKKRSNAMDHQLLDERKPDPERRTTVIPIFGRYLPMVRLDNGACDGQPHTHAFRFAGEKWFEDLL